MVRIPDSTRLGCRDRGDPESRGSSPVTRSPRSRNRTGRQPRARRPQSIGQPLRSKSREQLMQGRRMGCRRAAGSVSVDTLCPCSCSESSCSGCSSVLLRSSSATDRLGALSGGALSSQGFSGRSSEVFSPSDRRRRSGLPPQRDHRFIGRCDHRGARVAVVAWAVRLSVPEPKALVMEEWVSAIAMRSAAR